MKATVMSIFLRLIRPAALSVAMATLLAGSAMALPIGKAPTPAWGIATSSEIDTIRFRNRGGNFSKGLRGGRRVGVNRGYRGNRYRNNYGRNAGIGIGAAIIGGAILSEAARAAQRRDNGGGWERCADTYKSFERSTGMYTGYDGVRRTCPYLN